MTKSTNCDNLLMYLLVGCLFAICLKIYSESDVYNLKCIIAEKDGKRYCVRERKDLKEAANLLASVVERTTKLVNYMEKTYPTDEAVERLVEGYNPHNISETIPTSELTAYSENKGEKLAFCLNKTKNSTRLIDINTLTFVSIHELAHIMSETIGHKQEFWKNFKRLLENAEIIDIYHPVDYNKKPQGYCGMTISDSPYFDL